MRMLITSLLLLLSFTPKVLAVCIGTPTTGAYSLAAGGSSAQEVNVTRSATLGNYSRLDARLCAGNALLNEGAEVTGSVASEGFVELGIRAIVGGDVDSTNRLVLAEQASVSGALTSSGGRVELGIRATVGGNITSQNNIDIDEGATVDGNITANDGRVEVGVRAQVSGDVNARGIIELEEGAKVDGNLNAIDGRVVLGIRAEITGSIATARRVELGEGVIVGSSIISGARVDVGVNAKVGTSITAEIDVELSSGAEVGASIISNRNVTLGSNATVGTTVTASGNVELGANASIKDSLAAGGNVTLDENARVESGGINATGRVTLEKNTQVTGGITSQSTVTLSENVKLWNGGIDAEGNISLDKNIEVNGDIMSNGTLTLGDNVKVVGNVCATSGVNFGANASVSGTVTEGVDCLIDGDYNLFVDASLDALTCEPHVISIQINDSDGAVITNYTSTITLSVDNNKGVWSKLNADGTLTNVGSADDGQASYQFLDSDDGIIELGLSNDVAGDIVITVSDGVESAISNTITFHTALIKTELSCVNTIDDTCINTANLPFSLTLTAVQESDETSLCESYDPSGIQFWSEYTTPSTPTGVSVEVGVTDLTAIGASEATATAFSPSFVNGVATVTANYADAGLISIHVKDSDNEQIIGEASIALNPLQLEISTVTGNKRNNTTTLVSTTSNPATGASGNGFIRASVPDYNALTVDSFDVTVQAVKDCSDATTAINCAGAYGSKTPSFSADISLQTSLVFPSASGATLGVLHSEDGLTDTMAVADAGEIVFSDLAYDEVGALGLALLSDEYLGLSENTISSEKDDAGDDIVTEIGRFYPAYISYGDHSMSAGCHGFTYMMAEGDETPRQQSAVSVDYVLQAKAQTSSGATEQSTVNYDDSFGYPVASSFSHSAYSKSNLVELTTRLKPSVYYDEQQWSAGSYIVSAQQIGLQKNASVDGPYFAEMPHDSSENDQLEYYIQLSGDDGEKLQTDLITDCSADKCRLPSDDSESSLGDFAYGRLQAGNGHGSELQSIRTLIKATYYNGSAFVTFADDSCTPLLNEQLSTSPEMNSSNEISVAGGNSTLTLLTTNLSAGEGYLSFSAPNTRGSLDYFIRLLDASDSTLYTPWLLDSGNQLTCPASAGGLDECISGHVEFGVFRGNDRILYRQ